jgi:antitoxin Phd
MPSRATAAKRRSRNAGALPSWKLEDAKARFSQLVRSAESAGPQCVTVRGRPAVVVLSRAAFDRLAADEAPGEWVSRLGAVGRRGLALVTPERERDRGRDVDP